VEGDFDQKHLSRVREATRIEQVGGRVIVYGQGDALVERVVSTLSKKGIRYRDLRTEQPNLEDVFLALTGREMEGTEQR
jgi:ABC-2 type transport system ATP-binding protein